MEEVQFAGFPTHGYRLSATGLRQRPLAILGNLLQSLICGLLSEFLKVGAAGDILVFLSRSATLDLAQPTNRSYVATCTAKGNVVVGSLERWEDQ
ncbi:hypothetical protein R1flu_019035 [Riccia fluitans]|uniref:Uncharacterized protein n=1 Tax=Riccia fluitans TaxID=41844 RepID=A0ABD1ZHR3_9MARC